MDNMAYFLNSQPGSLNTIRSFLGGELGSAVQVGCGLSQITAKLQTFTQKIPVRKEKQQRWWTFTKPEKILKMISHASLDESRLALSHPS